MAREGAERNDDKGADGTHSCPVCKTTITASETATANPLYEFLPVLDAKGKLKLLRTFRL